MFGGSRVRASVGTCLKGFGWPISRIKRAELQYYQQKRAEQGLPPLLPAPEPEKQRQWTVVGRYEYRTPSGRLVSVILRFAQFPNRPSTRKYEREYTPVVTPVGEIMEEGFWLSDPLNGALPERDRVLARPLYRLPFRPGSTIWVVSSEFAADALAEMAPDKDFTTVCRTIPPAHLCDYDLAPLKGHDVWCVASQLQGSKARMKLLSERLRNELGVSDGARAPRRPGQGDHRPDYLGWLERGAGLGLYEGGRYDHRGLGPQTENAASAPPRHHAPRPPPPYIHVLNFTSSKK